MKFVKKTPVQESVELKQSEEKQEVLQEAVSKERGYTRSGIANAFQNVFEDIDEETFKALENDLYDYYGNVHKSWSNELTAEEVDDLLNKLSEKYVISPEKKVELENFIVSDISNDPVKQRKEDFEDDLRHLKEFLEEASESEGYYTGSITVSSKKFYDELVGFLNHLEELHYTGAEKE